MASRTHVFQPPKGTRDFFPEEMAVRRHVESAWRSVSVNHGFDEIDGPTFEHLELYTVKSGDEIVSELFSFRRAGGETDYALRPEFTPTLARMVAARGAQLPKPIKWFSVPSHYRAERPQRGRLREFVQWNVDMIGDDSPRADAEVIAVAIESLRALGLGSQHVTVKISNRDIVMDTLRDIGVAEKNLTAALQVLDRREKLPADEYAKRCGEIGLDADRLTKTLDETQQNVNEYHAAVENDGSPASETDSESALGSLYALIDALGEMSLLKWCETDLSIVRGLAYYTGTVFEVHEATGKERAIAGGGRYDQLIELFGGKPTPAVGFAMGDVVLGLVLEDHGLLEAGGAYLPRPDVFVIAADDEKAQEKFVPLVTELRRAGLHVRHSYRASKNVGKLLGDANKSRARNVVILGEELQRDAVVLKNLDTGDQREVAINEIASVLADQAASLEQSST